MEKKPIAYIRADLLADSGERYDISLGIEGKGKDIHRLLGCIIFQLAARSNRRPEDVLLRVIAATAEVAVDSKMDGSSTIDLSFLKNRGGTNEKAACESASPTSGPDQNSLKTS